MAKKPERINHLKRSQQRKLEDHLTANWKEISRNRLTSEQVAELASKKLGFRVSPQNVRSAAKTMELKWVRPVPVFNRSSSKAMRMRPTMLAVIGICKQLCEVFSLDVPNEFAVFEKAKGSAQYRYQPVVSAILPLLKELSSVAEIDFPEELEKVITTATAIEPEAEVAS